MSYQVDFSLWNPKKKQEIIQEEPIDTEKESEVDKDVEMNDSNFSLIDDEDDTEVEEKTPVMKKELNGVNKDVFSTDSQSLENKITTFLNTKTTEKEEPSIQDVVEEEPKHIIKVLCIGGSEIFYKNTLENLHEKYKDIKFIKYIASGSKTTMLTIDTLLPDIVLFAYNAQMQNALQFWQAVQTDVASDGTPCKVKFANKRLVVLAPNDLSYEIEMKSNGIEFFVKETNPRTHEVNVEELVNILRVAYKDIEQSQTVETLETVETTETEVEEISEISKNTETEEEISNIEIINDDVSEVENLSDNLVQYENKPEPPTKIIKEKIVKPTSIAMQPTEINLEGQKVIGVYSATGGAGKTTFATNLGAILAKYSNQANTNEYRVCLLEYNLSCQNIDLFFNIKADKDIGLLAMELGEKVNDKGVIDLEPSEMKPRLSSYIYKDPASGVDIMLGISVPLEMDRIRDGFTKSLIRTLKEMYDVVIIDISSDIAKTPVLECFNELDVLYYVLPMDVASIRNTRILLKFFKSLMKFSNEQLKVILNKVDPNNKEFGIDQVYTAFAADNCVPEGAIPFAGNDILSSINRGVPIAIENIAHPVSQAIYSIAVGINPMLSMEQMVTETQAKPKKKGLFSGLFGGKKKKKEEESSSASKPKKTSKGGLFSRKKKNVNELPPAPIEETKSFEPTKKKKSLFSNKFSKSKKAEGNNNPPVIQEEPQKKGIFDKLFGGLFGSKKKQQQEIGIKKKKKSSGFGGFFKKKEAPIELEEGESTQISRRGTSRLQSLRKPIRRE